MTSVEDIDRKLDALVAAGKVDPALLLTTSKMYMSVKESPYTSEEVKDIMAHLYWRVSTYHDVYMVQHACSRALHPACR